MSLITLENGWAYLECDDCKVSTPVQTSPQGAKTWGYLNGWNELPPGQHLCCGYGRPHKLENLQIPASYSLDLSYLESRLFPEGKDQE